MDLDRARSPLKWTRIRAGPTGQRQHGIFLRCVQVKGLSLAIAGLSSPIHIPINPSKTLTVITV
jgi:hypothetical protein